MRKLLIPLLLVPLLSGGCVKTVVGVATMPVKAAGKAVDWTTTSQEEADRNYGRKMRKQEAKEGRERKKADEEARKQAERDAQAAQNSGD